MGWTRQPEVPKVAEDEVDAQAEPEKKSLVELITELVDMVNRFVREQAHATLQKAIVQPLQKLGLNLAFTIVAGAMLAIAVIFLAVGSFLFLAQAVGYPWAYVIIGVFYVAIAAVLIWLRTRSMQ